MVSVQIFKLQLPNLAITKIANICALALLDQVAFKLALLVKCIYNESPTVGKHLQVFRESVFEVTLNPGLEEIKLFPFLINWLGGHSVRFKNTTIFGANEIDMRATPLIRAI